MVTPEMYSNVHGIHRHSMHCRVYNRPIGHKSTIIIFLRWYYIRLFLGPNISHSLVKRPILSASSYLNELMDRYIK